MINYNPFSMAKASRSVSIEQFQLLMRHLPMVIGASFISYFVVVYWLYQRNGEGVLIALLVITFVLAVFRLISFLKHRRVPTAYGNVDARMNLMAFYAFASGLLWGYLSLVNISHDDPTTSLIIIMVLTGLVASATASLSHMPWMFSLFVVPTMMPTAIRFLTFEDKTSDLIGVLMIVYLFVSYRFSLGIRDSALRGINLKFENIDLIEKLTIEKKRAENAQINAEQSNMAKSKFLAAASHDLRQPLNSLRLFATTLNYSVVEQEHKELAKHIDRSVTALQGLFDALLDISRLDSGTMKIAKTSFDLQVMLNQVCNGFRAQATNKGVDFELECGQIFVYSDPILIERVLNNIISNALNCTAEGSVSVTVDQRPDSVILDVCDTGCGIPADKQGIVFGEFVQLENSERDRTKGLGLGLSIVRRITDLLDIPLALQSDPTWGTKITLELKRSSVDVVSTEPDKIHLEVTLESLFVCFIDDEEDARLAMTLFLENRGCIVLAAASAVECEDLLADYEYDPDVIIADYRLRDRQSGSDAIDRICKLVGKALPAIIITGDVEPDRLREINAGKWLVMHKPADPAQLLAFLKNCQSQLVGHSDF